MIGQTISHYRIDARLGAGGMGEIFQATDTRHSRPVALKVVSEKLLADPEARRRFLQEAKTASSLQHPNIVTIYDSGSAGDQCFIAMELIQGPTLEGKLAAGPVPLRETLRYGIQIAQALSSAHSAGIVHRDLKPANVMISANGEAKILDFGLAKRDTPFGGSASSETERLTASAPALTEVGTILGTVLYMSPEQAEGKPVDARSDVFSFGSLLYEMLSGRKAFAAETKMASLSAILQTQPPSLPELPPRLNALLERCLRKDPHRRAQSMADVRVELEDILAELDAPREAGVARPTRRWLLPGLAGAAAAGIPAAFLAARLRPTKAVRHQRITFRRGDLFGARFAPGGNIVYAAEWDGANPGVFVTQVGTREARDLNLRDCRVAAISARGELALIRQGYALGTSGLLLRVPLGGSAPRELLEAVASADWAPDGEQLAVCRTVDGSHRIEYPIGKVVYTL